MKVDIWSDVVCPWCYIGKRNFEAALAHFPHRDEVEVRWHSFELDPGADPVPIGTYVQRLGDKYGTSAAEAQQMLDTMTARAAAVDLEFHFDKAQGGNTFDAHRLLHLAATRGLQAELKERLMRASFTDGEAIGDKETLERIALEVGLDAREVRTVLSGDAYAADVRHDEEQAARIGIRGVPFFVVDRTYGVSGAQPAEVLLQVLERAWDESRPVSSLAGHE